MSNNGSSVSSLVVRLLLMSCVLLDGNIPGLQLGRFDDKSIQTGVTLHSLTVTRGKLMFYQLYARTYGGASDGDIQGRHEHTQSKAKFVNLFDMMLSKFFVKGHHVTCDSAYGQ